MQLYRKVSEFIGSLNWASSLSPLGRLYMRPLQQHFYSLGLTDRFAPPCQSDPLVPATLLRQWQDLSSLTSGIPIRPFQADFTIFTDASTQGWGTHLGDSQILGVWARSDRKLHINVLELKAVRIGPPTLGLSITGPSGYDCTDNTTVVAYINKQGGTHSHTLLRLVVELFLWLQSQDITIRARHTPDCLNVIADRLSRPNQPIMTEWSLHPEVVNLLFKIRGTPVVDMFSYSPQHTSSSVYVSSSRATSTGDRCSVTVLAGTVDVHVSTLSPAQQSHSETQDDPGG